MHKFTLRASRIPLINTNNITVDVAMKSYLIHAQVYSKGE